MGSIGKLEQGWCAGSSSVYRQSESKSEDGAYPDFNTGTPTFSKKGEGSIKSLNFAHLVHEWQSKKNKDKRASKKNVVTEQAVEQATPHYHEEETKGGEDRPTSELDLFFPKARR